jgi:hypothetical protein
MSKLIRRKRFYIAPLVITGILIALFLLPSSALSVTVNVSPGSKTVTGVQEVTYIAKVQLLSGESVDEATVQVGSYAPVNLPLAEGSGVSVALPAGAGSLVVDVAYQDDIVYNFGYGYSASGGAIVHTMRYTPPRTGGFSLKVQAEGATGEATLRVLIPPVPTPTPIPEEDRVIVPPSAGGGAKVVEVGEPTQITTSAGDVTLDVPSVFVDEPVQVVVDVIDPSDAPAPGAGMKVLRALSINVYDLLGNQITVVTGTPVKLKIKYTDADVAAVGGDPSRLVIMRYVNGRWVSLKTTVDVPNKLLITNLTTFSLFAVGGQVAQPGDINLDGAVDYLDLAIFGASYGSNQGDPLYRGAADLNSDGRINHLDLAIFGANYSPRR